LSYGCIVQKSSVLSIEPNPRNQPHYPIILREHRVSEKSPALS